MLRSICTKKGMSMIEVLIAIFLTSIGIMALLSLQPSGWKTTARSDYLGRASGILYKTLEDNETRILNPCYHVTLVTNSCNNSVNTSDQSSAISGDVTYTVCTTIVQDGAAFVVTVTVTWPTSPTGISESLAVTRQELYRFPAGCPNA